MGGGERGLGSPGRVRMGVLGGTHKLEGGYRYRRRDMDAREGRGYQGREAGAGG